MARIYAKNIHSMWSYCSYYTNSFCRVHLYIRNLISINISHTNVLAQLSSRKHSKWCNITALYFLQTQITDSLKDASLKPKFTKLAYLRKFEALLVLSENAGVLLRHRQLAFLYSLSHAMRVHSSRVLVLVRCPTPAKSEPWEPQASGALIV